MIMSCLVLHGKRLNITLFFYVNCINHRQPPPTQKPKQPINKNAKRIFRIDRHGRLYWWHFLFWFKLVCGCTWYFIKWSSALRSFLSYSQFQQSTANFSVSSDPLLQVTPDPNSPCYDWQHPHTIYLSIYLTVYFLQHLRTKYPEKKTVFNAINYITLKIIPFYTDFWTYQHKRLEVIMKNKRSNKQTLSSLSWNPPFSILWTIKIYQPTLLLYLSFRFYNTYTSMSKHTYTLWPHTTVHILSQLHAYTYIRNVSTNTYFCEHFHN